MKVHVRGLIYILILIMTLGGCTEKDIGIRIQPDVTQDSTPIVIGEDPNEKSDEVSTKTIVIDKTIDNNNILEKTLTEEVTKNDSEKSGNVDAMILDNWTWERDHTLTLVKGSLHNVGNTPIGFFRIRAEYVDKDGNVVDTDIAVYGEVVWPGHQKMFKISKLYDEKHISVRIWIDQAKAAKEPIIHAVNGTNAEIVEGWTWTNEGQFSYIDGSIQNIGEKDIRYFKIMAEYSNGDGQVLDSDFTNSNEVLKPGNKQSFRVMHPYDSEFEEVTIYISQIR